MGNATCPTCMRHSSKGDVMLAHVGICIWGLGRAQSTKVEGIMIEKFNTETISHFSYAIQQLTWLEQVFQA